MLRRSDVDALSKYAVPFILHSFGWYGIGSRHKLRNLLWKTVFGWVIPVVITPIGDWGEGWLG